MKTLNELYNRYMKLQAYADYVYETEGDSPAHKEAQKEANVAFVAYESVANMIEFGY